MSGAGISPLAIYDPQTYAAQIAIQRRQALAQSLLQGGEANPGSAAYGGLANAGKSILGAFLAKRADRELGDLYNPQANQTNPQLTNGADQPQIRSQALGQALTGSQDTAGQATLPSPPQTSAPMQPSAAGDKPSDYVSMPPQAQHIYDQIPHIPGMPARQALNFFLTNPNGYQAEWAKQFEATDMQKNTSAAYGSGTPEAQAMMRGTLAKGAAINLRPGGGALNYADGSIVTMPGQNGVQTLFPQGMAGGAIQQMAPGGAQAQAQAAYSQQAPKALLTPTTGYDASHQPIASNALTMSGNAAAAPQLGIGQQPPNINANNPLNVQSGGRDIQYATPTAGLGKAWETLGSYGQKGINTVQKIVSTWAPGAPPQYVANVAQALKVDPNQPLNMADPNVKGALIDAMRPNETGNRYAPPQGTGLAPELPVGQATYMQGQAKDAADRHDAVVAAASESPMRINVLDNIIKLSTAGVQTGPGSEWQNAVKGYIANTPGLGKLFGSTQENVGNFQELQKFMYQNALRNWQAAGGTGTDSQLESAAKANPNDHLFPQALQTIAKWGKAAELAVQGKANAQDQFLQQAGQTPKAQIAFENQWRNSFDPKVFQYSLMSPQEKQTFAANVLKTPATARAFIAKQQQLRQLGAIQ